MYNYDIREHLLGMHDQLTQVHAGAATSLPVLDAPGGGLGSVGGLVAGISAVR